MGIWILLNFVRNTVYFGKWNREVEVSIIYLHFHENNELYCLRLGLLVPAWFLWSQTSLLGSSLFLKQSEQATTDQGTNLSQLVAWQHRAHGAVTRLFFSDNSGELIDFHKGKGLISLLILIFYMIRVVPSLSDPDWWSELIRSNFYTCLLLSLTKMSGACKCRCSTL